MRASMKNQCLKISRLFSREFWYGYGILNIIIIYILIWINLEEISSEGNKTEGENGFNKLVKELTASTIDFAKGCFDVCLSQVQSGRSLKWTAAPRGGPKVDGLEPNWTTSFIFETFHSQFLRPSSSIRFYRSVFALWTVHFETFELSSLIHGRPVSAVWTVKYNPHTLTQDRQF